MYSPAVAITCDAIRITRRNVQADAHIRRSTTIEKIDISHTLSIIIPAYNRPQKTRRAVESIVAQNIACEIIVVDDASTQKLTLKGLQSANCDLHLIRRSVNGGAGAARNSGIEVATGEFIAFLDSDDVLIEGTLVPRLEFARLQKATNSGNNGVPWVVCCGWDEVDGAGYNLRSRLPVATTKRSDFFTGCWFSPGSTMICETKLFKETIGGYDEQLRRLEDFDWFMRFGMSGGKLMVQQLSAATIEIERNKDVFAVQDAGEKLVQKYRGLNVGTAELKMLQAYAYLENAVANWHAGNYPRALLWLAKSLTKAPRVKLQMSPGWR